MQGAHHQPLVLGAVYTAQRVVRLLLLPLQGFDLAPQLRQLLPHRALLCSAVGGAAMTGQLSLCSARNFAPQLPQLLP